MVEVITICQLKIEHYIIADEKRRQEAQQHFKELQEHFADCLKAYSNKIAEIFTEEKNDINNQIKNN